MTAEEGVTLHSIKAIEGITTSSVIECIPSPSRSTAIDACFAATQADNGNSFSNKPLRLLLPIAKRNPIGSVGGEAPSQCDVAEPHKWISEKENDEECVVGEENRRGQELRLESTPLGFAPMSSGASSSLTTTVSSGFNCNNSLSIMNDCVLIPTSDRRFAFEETFLIFDWDDTLLPTTWIQRQGLLDENSDLTTWQQELLGQVANRVAQTLCIGKQKGTIVIVSNAGEGWVEWSCQKFMPILSSTLMDIKILSARSTYENLEYVSPSDWKLRAFENEIERIYGPEIAMDSNMRKNVLSLGDSLCERDALFKATGFLPNCRSKSLKFAERPDPSLICNQHSFIITYLDHIVHHDADLDICIKRP